MAASTEVFVAVNMLDHFEFAQCVKLESREKVAENKVMVAMRIYAWLSHVESLLGMVILKVVLEVDMKAAGILIVLSALSCQHILVLLLLKCDYIMPGVYLFE